MMMDLSVQPSKEGCMYVRLVWYSRRVESIKQASNRSNNEDDEIVVRTSKDGAVLVVARGGGATAINTALDLCVLVYRTGQHIYPGHGLFRLPNENDKCERRVGVGCMVSYPSFLSNNRTW